MSELAINGGKPLRKKSFAAWPIYDKKEERALLRVLKSRSWGGYPSPNTEASAFAAEFAEFQGSPHAILCANGTLTLKLALLAGGVGYADEVIVPALTFVATAGACVDVNAIPVFCDIDPDTYCIDATKIEALITKKTKAIIPVHLACSMADMDAVMEIAKKHSLLVIEDCAHAHGTRWEDQGAGCIGDFGSFSFQSSKLMTSGEGGAITCKTIEHRDRLLSLLNCGRKDPPHDKFEGRVFGHNLRISEFQAAVLRCQLSRFEKQIEKTRKNREKFVKKLVKSGVPGLRPLDVDERVTRLGAYQFILRFDSRAWDGLHRDKFVDALNAEGIPCDGDFYRSLQTHELFPLDTRTNPLRDIDPKYDPRKWKTPASDHAGDAESVWFSHTFFLDGEKDVADIVLAIAKVYEHRAELLASKSEA
ncbi:MAG: DegT/DnrJ/EryC1/StrS family aminotransferase [Planctomycetes bacterium]|nr:DegT/DnrJ/EryC1/StrS family aminotransferase [Planctomycetota bacterium]